MRLSQFENIYWKTQSCDFIWYISFNSIMNETQFFIKCTSDREGRHRKSCDVLYISQWDQIYIYDGCLTKFIDFVKSIELFFVMCAGISRVICWKLNIWKCRGIICSREIFVQSFVSCLWKFSILYVSLRDKQVVHLCNQIEVNNSRKSLSLRV